MDYTASEFMSTIDSAVLEAGLQTQLLGHPLRYEASVPSTQELVREAARGGGAEGLVVVAGEQTAGRGRGGRSWWSPASGGLYLSMLLRPVLDAQYLAWLTMCVALGTVQAIEDVCRVFPQLKWPNDLEWRGRKLAGILAEGSFSGDRLDYTVVGLGLNVNIDFRSRPDLAEQAISLQEITGDHVDPASILVAVLERTEGHYLALRQGVSPVPAWTARLVTLGQPVVATTGDGQVIHGLAEQVMPDGALTIRLADGSETSIRALDVTIRRKPYDD
jgi:BirA family biotin operon repressor/biotin-[acetyl-CoA-carboxylase] ligase